MSLVLTIVRQPPGTDVAKSRMTFGASGGTIGRNATNDWQLPDPDRFVSSRHASIRCEGGQYYLVDTSTNGVYYNNTEEPLGTGNQAMLSEGDRLYFGEYELLVAFEQSPVADNMNLNDFDQWLDPVSANDILADKSDGSVGNDFLMESEELDPLAAFDKALPSSGMPSSNAIPDDDDWLGASQPDNASPMEQAFSIAAPVSDPLIPEPRALEAIIPEPINPEPSMSEGAGQAIPDDWDIDDLLGGGEPEELAAPKAPEPLAKPVPQPAKSIPVPSQPPKVMNAEKVTSAAKENVKTELDEIESLLDVDIKIPEAQQDIQDAAQRETNELDAFLGLGDAQQVPSTPPSAASSVDPLIAEPEANVADDELSIDDFLSVEDPVVESLVVDDFVAEKNQQKIPEPAVESEQKTASVQGVVVEKSGAVEKEAVSQNNTPQESISDTDQVSELISSLGLNPEQVSPEQRANFNQLIADMLRESTKGMMAVLGARNAIKNEFRMNVTLIQAAENNPLKFSPNVDEALRNMFVSQNNAYLPGILAIRHGFQDIADHQIAVIAGMREAFTSMMKQFDPQKLAVRFDKQQTRGGLMKGKSAKYWESYAEYYQYLANNMDDSFQDLFGEEFAEAYEQQMNTLAASRAK